MVKLPIGVDINNLIDDLRIFSWETADILIYYSNLLKNTQDQKKILKNKDENNPVTLADLKVNDLLVKRINENYKDVSWQILTEENVKSSNVNLHKNSDWLWVIDPLDGTKDFLQGTGNYAMHLALNYKQKSFMGLVLIPVKNELWITNGEKVWGERRDGSKINCKLSKKESLKEMTLVTSKNHGNDTLNKLINKIDFENVVVMGSIGCKIASLIKGESDIYICLSLPGQSSPKDWDFAAPEAILKAAGGSVTNLDNEELSYNNPQYEQRGIIVASSNKKIHKNICLEIKRLIDKYHLINS